VSQQAVQTVGTEEIVARLRRAVRDGEDWPMAVIDAMAAWTAPVEKFRGVNLKYFIAGEAFDWLTLAQRLSVELSRLVPDDEVERLLFSGKFPLRIDEGVFRDVLGVEKFRGILNYFYGVTVEEALLYAVECEIQKRLLSNGIQFNGDLSERAFMRLYRRSEAELLRQFREEMGYPQRKLVPFSQYKEFTYWLFKYRVRNSDKAKTASDTRKGLEQLEEMTAAHRAARALAVG
jgi:hypothetical protein